MYVISARKEKGRRVGQELDIFVQEKFRAVINKKEKVNNYGETSYEMDWKNMMRLLRFVNFLTLCFLKIPKNKFEVCSKAMKVAGSRYIDSINHQPCT